MGAADRPVGAGKLEKKENRKLHFHWNFFRRSVVMVVKERTNQPMPSIPSRLNFLSGLGDLKEARMTRKSLLTLMTLAVTVLSAACSPKQASPTPAAGMPNPASVYCEQNGGRLDLRQDASGGVAGVCVFPDGSECEEWAYFRGQCQPAGVAPVDTPSSAPIVPSLDPTSAPNEIPTVRPINAADYQGWWTYTNPVYGFSLLLPFDWVVEETTTGDPLMNGHTLFLKSPQGTGEGQEIRMTFRRSGEDVPLWPTGVGSGEFVPQGTLDVAGLPARRVFFVCPAGQVQAVWYHDQEESTPNILRGDLEFGFILSLSGFYCEQGHSLGGSKFLYVGELVIASLSVP
jgi:putative hemolysin